MRKSVCTVLLLALVCALCLCVAVLADGTARAGDFGEGLHWSVDESGLLLIEGKGEVPDWKGREAPPWNSYEDAITSARVGEGITGIGIHSFFKLKRLETLELPESLTSLSSGAISFCSALETLTIPDGVISMYRALDNCSGLRILRLGAGVESQAVCLYCNSLERIEVSAANESLKDVDGVLCSRDGTILYCYPSGRSERRYVVPDGVEELGEYSFYGLQQLEELVLPEGLYRIGKMAFDRGISLKKILLPATLRELEYGVFSMCSSDLKLCFDGPEALLAGILVGYGNEDLYSLGCELGGEHSTLHRLNLNINRNKTWVKLLVAEGYPIPALPTPEEEPTEAGPFRGWFLSEAEDAEELISGSDCTATADLTVYARWWKRSRLNLYPAGGSLSGADHLFLSEADDYVLSELPEAPVRPGWLFTGWYLSGGTKELAAPGQRFPSGGDLIARWEPDFELVERNAKAGVCAVRTLTGTASQSYYALYPWNSVWASTIKTYAVPEDDGSLSCVCLEDKALLISRYAPDGTLRSERTLALELPIFGGFYAGETDYYVVSGQTNYEEDDTKEVIRVTRYDRDWNRIDAVAIRDCYTCIPFDAGTLRMAENGNQLLIHTAREHYRSEDGRRHQSQLTILIDTDTMRVVNRLSEFQANHVSHSFNQFVLPEGDGFAVLDHGDGAPRSVVLHHLTQQVPTEIDLFSIPGPVGYNWTGVSVGGFAATEGGFTAVINSVDQSLATSYSSYSDFIESIERNQRDILVLSTAADNRAEENVVQTKLTDYIGNGRTCSAPYLVSLGPDLLCALWQEFRLDDQTGVPTNLGLRYVLLNGNATPLSDLLLLPDAQLSQDCQPVVWNGRIVWFVDMDGIRTLYSLDVSDPAGEDPVVPEPEPEPELPFTDVQTGDWFYPYVRFIYEQGIMNGTGAGIFSPKATTTRAQLVTMLYRLEGSPAVSEAPAFDDVPAGEWYTAPVAWASGRGVVAGYGDGTFGPHNSLTREQLALMLWRYAGKPEGAGELGQFADADRVDAWAADALRWCVGRGIVTGKGGGILDPLGDASRAEIATMLMRFMQL